MPNVCGIVLYILSLCLTTSGIFYIPLLPGETARVWCRGYDIEFGRCRIRGDTSCHRDFTSSDTDLPLSLSCIAKSREGWESVTLSVEVVQQVFNLGNVEVRSDNLSSVVCLEETEVKVLKDDPRETYPMLWWASDSRGPYATGNILDTEYVKQKFWSVQSYSLLPGDVVYCNGTRLSYADLHNLTSSTQPPVNKTAPPVIPTDSTPNNDTAVDSNTENKPGIPRTVLLSVVISGVVLISCLVCVPALICWRKRQTQSQHQALPLNDEPSQHHNHSEHQENSSDPSSYNLYDDIDLEPGPSAYNSNLRLTPSPKICPTQNRKFLTEENSCPETYSYAVVRRPPLPPPIFLPPPSLQRPSITLGYSQLHDPLPETSPARYNVIDRSPELGGRPDDGLRYNRLARDGPEDVNLQYNVLMK